MPSLPSSQTFRIVIYGTGAFSKKISNIFNESDLEVSYYIDDFRVTDIEKTPVINSENYHPNDVDIVFIGIGDYHRAIQARDNLLRKGTKPNQIKMFGNYYQSIIESALSMLKLMISIDPQRAFNSLIQSQGFCQNWENIFFQNQTNIKKHISIRLFGCKNGFMPHLTEIPRRLQDKYSCNIISDNPRSTYTSYISSRLAMLNTDAKLVICASLSPCSPPNTKKLSILHMLYDSALLSNVHKDLAQSKNNYIAIPSRALMKQFQGVCIKHNLKNVTLIPAGYPKLDLAVKKFKRATPSDSLCLLYTPTEFANKSKDDLDGALSIFSAQATIEELLLNFSDLHIIFRPYPDDLFRYELNHHTPAYHAMKNLVEMCNANPRIQLDSNQTHQKSYEKADILLTDISSTAFSFAFTTGKPVMFLSNEKIERSEKWQTTQYMRDRQKIGEVIECPEVAVTKLNNLLLHSREFAERITILRKTELYNFRNSENYILNAIEHILKNKKMDDWWSLKDQILYEKTDNLVL